MANEVFRCLTGDGRGGFYQVQSMACDIEPWAAAFESSRPQYQADLRGGAGMEYVEYFRKFPDAYAKIMAGLDRVRTLYAYLNEGGFLDGAESILSIGSGTGEVEIRIARETGRWIAVVEPSQMYCDAFNREAAAAGIMDRVLEARQQSFEDYQPRRQFDVVMSLFSWFAFEFDRDLLFKALSCRAADGKLLICLPTDDCPASRISSFSRSEGINLTSNALSAWARREGFGHDYDLYHGLVPADRYIRHDALTTEGRDLASFLSATPWENLSEELRHASLEALQAARINDEIDHASGCLIFDAKKHALPGAHRR